MIHAKSHRNAGSRRLRHDISKDRKVQIEYLLDQSIQGNHVLFDHDTMTRVLKDGKGNGLLRPLSEEEASLVERHIERLIGEPSLTRKRAYLESLDPRAYAWVIRTYFNIVENNLWETQEIRH